MLRKENNGIVWFEFELLQPFRKVRHAIFSRLGGESSGPYSQLNLSFTVGDNPETVEKNRQKAFVAIDLSNSVKIIQPEQVHKSDVHCMKACRRAPLEADSLITNEDNVALTIQHADCQAAICYDPVSDGLACVHSGWRGSVGNIYKETIAQMAKEFGTKPEDLIVCISPSLGPENAQFINYRSELPPSFQQFQVKELYFDFWQISRWQLEQEGVQAINIEIAETCTYADREHFFSFRRDKLCGRHLTICWKCESQSPFRSLS